MELEREFEPEGMLRQYPYGTAMGQDLPVITLFHGDDYSGYDPSFGFSLNPIKAIKSAGKFVSNAVKTAGREIGHVTKGIQSVAGYVGKGIGYIPVVGGPLHTVFDAGFNIGMAPVKLTNAVVLEGRRIDKAVLDNLKEQLHEFKQVAPYAQMVISIVPGVGTGVSACLSAGLALAEGQSIEEVLKAGAIGAIPGGPLVKAAVTMGVETIQHVAKGEKLDLATLGKTAGGIAGSALGLPIAASNALVGGVAIMGNITAGKPLDKTLTDGVIRGLPVSDTVKKAMTEATAISVDLAKGKTIDNAMMNRVNAIRTVLPARNPLSDSIKTSLLAGKKLGAAEAAKVLSAGINSGMGDTLVSMGAVALPPDVQKGVKAGVGLGSGVVFQAKRKGQLPKVKGKLVQSGVELAKSSPVVNAARKLASTKGGTKGFDLGSGLMQQQVGVFDVTTVRNSLSVPDKLGFDMALATRIGTVANPKPTTLSPEAHAGNAITLGMQGYTPDKKVAIMQTVQSNASATVGATAAVQEIVQKREGILIRLLKALGLRK